MGTIVASNTANGQSQEQREAFLNIVALSRSGPTGARLASSWCIGVMARGKTAGHVSRFATARFGSHCFSSRPFGIEFLPARADRRGSSRAGMEFHLCATSAALEFSDSPPRRHSRRGGPSWIGYRTRASEVRRKSKTASWCCHSRRSATQRLILSTKPGPSRGWPRWLGSTGRRAVSRDCPPASHYITPPPSRTIV